MKISKKCLLILSAAAVAAVLAAVWFFSSHVRVDGRFYPARAQSLDLRDRELTCQQYDAIRQALPGCSIAWNVPFQDTACPHDTKELTLSRLEESQIPSLKYFPQLQTVNALGCTDYDALKKLQQEFPELQVLYSVPIGQESWPQDSRSIRVLSLCQEDLDRIGCLTQLQQVDARGCSDLALLRRLQEEHPHLQVDYSVPLSGQTFPRDTQSLSLSHALPAELADALWHLDQVTEVSLQEPAGTAGELAALTAAYPDIRFTWDKEIHGITVTSDQTEVDLSGTPLQDPAEAESFMAWFPNAEKLILCGCGFDNEEMAAYRDRVRSDYKVVWDVEVGYLTLRTDDTYYMPGKYNLGVTQEQAYNLRYCEDMICIDVGHKPLFTCEWAAFMPNLKYLIIADTMIDDISPLEGLDQLIYLEMFITKVTDLTPLLSCTALQDLNLCYTHADPEPVTQMTWLKNLWWAEPPLEEEVFQEYLPDTHLMFLHHSSTGNGWRQLQNYYDMRDILGMHYMWG